MNSKSGASVLQESAGCVAYPDVHETSIEHGCDAW